jgi:Lon protease-like protein
MFPLPNVWLFPFVLLPLQVFEERYKRLIEDSLDGPGRLVIGTVQLGHEHGVAGSPPIYPIAGLGEIGRHERLPDGRFNILLMGLQRVRVHELPSDRPYRMVEFEPTEEPPVAPERDPDLRERLVRSIQERTQNSPAFPPGIPLPHEVLNRLYCELDPSSRAELALAEHAVRPRTSRPQQGPQG